ncbi:MAG: metalloregulator ArsR/SmtB family transcription factor, partial [Solirubrobacteraceae bacterium]|nr:metalloregulator ArsR/SmtB family transcription factor [Solirubrobacteraceae bacterium]
DPTRRAILATLTAGPATVSEIAAPHDMSGPAISKHLRVLEKAGLITRGRDAQFRPATLAAEPLKEVVDYALDFRAFWDESFSRLDDYLARMQPPAERDA